MSLDSQRLLLLAVFAVRPRSIRLDSTAGKQYQDRGCVNELPSFGGICRDRITRNASSNQLLPLGFVNRLGITQRITADEKLHLPVMEMSLENDAQLSSFEVTCQDCLSSECTMNSILADNPVHFSTPLILLSFVLCPAMSSPTLFMLKDAVRVEVAIRPSQFSYSRVPAQRSTPRHFPSRKPSSIDFIYQQTSSSLRVQTPHHIQYCNAWCQSSSSPNRGPSLKHWSSQ